MATITIKDFGPIKEVENLVINKVNVFMGPQSSGKSTIAKIISYCAWVEKEVATTQSLGEYNVNSNFRKKLEEFHRLNGYFGENTRILYESEVIKIEFKNNKCSVEWVDQYAYKLSKIAYIPSERNLITLPFIHKVDLANNNIRSFLFDWLTISPQYHKENQVKILDLPVAYYFKENMGTGENHIVSTDRNNKYDILLENASSGLQSLTPLIVALKYLTEWIYENEENVSFEKQKKRDGVISQLITELIFKELYPEENFSNKNNFSKKLKEFYKLSQSGNEQINELLNGKFKVIWDNIREIRYSQFIIEEPEQNLFPSTQRDLVYHLLNLVQGKDHRLTITTHSPYILYALNNCMMGYLVNAQIQESEKNNFLSEQSWINPESVSVWEIEDGALRNIQDEDKIISKNYFDQKMTELIDEYYQMLDYYKDEK